MAESKAEKDYGDRCPKCGSQTPIGHRCIVDDLDAIRSADLSDHPLMEAIKGVAPQSESDVLPCWRGCPLDVGTGLRKHQWPCEFSGQADVVGSPVETCICHGEDRPHAPHQPCDRGCQPDWHRDDCAIYLPASEGGPA